MTTSSAHSPLPAGLASGTARSILSGGQWLPAASGRTMPGVNPSTGESFVALAAGDAEDIDRAVLAARAALEGPWHGCTPLWRQTLLLRLADAVEQHYDELRYLDSVEMGRPIGHPSTVAEGAELLRYYAGWPTKIYGRTIPTSSAGQMLTYTLKEPVGVVGAVIPWNGPIIASLKKIAPVLATGCTLVLKPAEDASLSVIRLAELITELELPDGVVNIVTGIGSEAGAALAAHPDVDKIAFTGSVATGQQIVRAAAGNLKRVSLELGGKSPNIIFADADLAQAIPRSAMGVFGNSGQLCCAGSRIYVEAPIYDEVVAGLAQVADTLKVGHSLDPDTEIGPLVSQRQLDRVCGYLRLGHEGAARAVAGGARATQGGLARGYFVRPTVFADVVESMPIAQDEIFGPVACVLPFNSEAEVIQRANATPFGLAAGVWSSDAARVHRLARQLRAGTVWLNTFLDMEATVPFGGYKASGWGRENGPESMDEYLNVKAVWARLDGS